MSDHLEHTDLGDNHPGERGHDLDVSDHPGGPDHDALANLDDAADRD